MDLEGLPGVASSTVVRWMECLGGDQDGEVATMDGSIIDGSIRGVCSPGVSAKDINLRGDSGAPAADISLKTLSSPPSVSEGVGENAVGEPKLRLDMLLPLRLARVPPGEKGELGVVGTGPSSIGPTPFICS